jgi:hypothetical protein
MSFIPSVLLRIYSPLNVNKNYKRPVIREKLQGSLKSIRGYAYWNLLYENYGVIVNVRYSDNSTIIYTERHVLVVESELSDQLLQMLSRPKQSLVRCMNVHWETFFTTITPYQRYWIDQYLKVPPHARGSDINQQWQFKEYPWIQSLL